MKIFQVGGSVRDELLGKKPHDIDYVVVGASASDMEKEGYVAVGKDFPVYLHPKTKDEYALARQERKTGPGHKGFQTVFGPDVTLEEDLLRRDLTINAIAKDPQSGQLFDPYGGVQDVKDKVLRHVSDAFSEDPLRVLRLIRFSSSLNFSIAPQTYQLALELCQKRALSELPAERIRAEWEKIIENSSRQCLVKAWQLSTELGVFGAFDPKWALLSPQAKQVFEQLPDNSPWTDSTFFLAVLASTNEHKDMEYLFDKLRLSSETKSIASKAYALEQKFVGLISEFSIELSKTASSSDRLALLLLELVEGAHLNKQQHFNTAVSQLAGARMSVHAPECASTFKQICPMIQAAWELYARTPVSTLMLKYTSLTPNLAAKEARKEFFTSQNDIFNALRPTALLSINNETPVNQTDILDSTSQSTPNRSLLPRRP